MIEVEESGDIGTPLHLKLVIYHENRIREGLDMQLDWSDTKTVLLPRQHLLKKLDPAGVLNVPQLREKLRPLVSEYERVVLKDVVPPGMDICQALKIYGYFHLIRYMQEWTENEIPVACSCKVCLTNCVCRCTLLFAAIFRPEVRVPDEYIAATVPERKQCKSIRGTAGKKRLRIMEERKCDEKKIDSKIKYMKGTTPVAAAPEAAGKSWRQPSPVMPSDTDDSDEPEVAVSS
jgi:hypothetical protein